MDLRKLQWSEPLLKFFGFKSSILPKLVSSSEVYGSISYGALKGVQVAGLVGDQQGALVGNKCFHQGEAKCTYGTGVYQYFLIIGYSLHGLQVHFCFLQLVRSLLPVKMD